MVRIELLVDGEKTLSKIVEYVDKDQITNTVSMILDYAVLHKGNKIRMLKGLQKLR